MTVTDKPRAAQQQTKPCPHTGQHVCTECGEVLDVELIDESGKPTVRGWREIGRRLSAKLQTRTFNAGRKGTFEYITARQVFELLDKTVGPGNWATQVQVVRAEHPVAVLVGLGILGVWKWDTGYSNNPDANDPEDKSFEDEPLKAAVSDGIKRVAVQWGVGRWLYPEMRS